MHCAAADGCRASTHTFFDKTHNMSARITQKITPFLWFNHQAEEAAKFYISIFKNSTIGKVTRYDEEAAKATGQPPGSLMTIEFELEGQRFVALNGGPHFK